MDSNEAIQYIKKRYGNISNLETLLFNTGEAIRLTREYVGEHLLPPLEGWSWFDAYFAIARTLDHDEMKENVRQWTNKYKMEQERLHMIQDWQYPSEKE